MAEKKKAFSISDFVKPEDVSSLDTPATAGKIINVPVESLQVNEKNFYDTSNVADLVKSIALNGLIEPIIVTPTEPIPGHSGPAYRIISGHRRFSAWHKLEVVIAANFSYQDLVLTLTYDDEHLPPSKREAVRLLKRFLIQLRSERQRHGQDLKYVYVTESKHGDGRIHHHADAGRHLRQRLRAHRLGRDGAQRREDTGPLPREKRTDARLCRQCRTTLGKKQGLVPIPRRYRQ